jgi:3-polyprenyl-4-hydroxybenzoate decarboxylase
MQQAVRKQDLEPRTKETRDLRSTLAWLKAEGDLIETDKEVDPDLQVTGLQKHMDGGCPVLFTM